MEHLNSKLICTDYKCIDNLSGLDISKIEDFTELVSASFSYMLHRISVCIGYEGSLKLIVLDDDNQTVVLERAFESNLPEYTKEKLLVLLTDTAKEYFGI